MENWKLLATVCNCQGHWTSPCLQLGRACVRLARLGPYRNRPFGQNARRNGTERGRRTSARKILRFGWPPPLDASSTVRLNIGGGKKFTTIVDTLTQREPDSMLAAMFSGRHTVCPDRDKGYIFVDRDGKYFRHILNWLRDGVVPTLSDSEYVELLREAEYYQLLGLMDGIHLVTSKRREADDLDTEQIRTDIIKRIQSERDVDAEGSIFHNVTLRECEFTGANLRGALLAGANLQDACLIDCNFCGADLRSAHLQTADLTNANLEGANLEGANLKGAKLSNANLKGANLQSTYLRHVNLRETHLEGAKLDGANLLDAIR